MTYTDSYATPALVGPAPRNVAASESFVVTVHDRIDQVSAEWPRGGADTEARCHAFQTVTYLETWQATYGKTYGARLCLVEVRDGVGKPVLMIPLMINRQRGSRVLAFTDFSVSDYNSPVLFPTNIVWTKRSAAALWQQIVARLPAFDLVLFDKMPEKVRDLVNPLYLLSDEPNAESCHLTNLDQPVADIEKAVRGVRTFKRHFRGLQRLGSCEIMIAETAEQRKLILDKLLEQKQRRFEETHVPGFEKHPEKRDFFALGTETFAAIGALHLSALVVNGQVLATTWGLTQGRHYYGLFLSFEAGEWGKYSPGRVLHHQLLLHLAERGYSCFDLGIGDEEWKVSVCDVHIPLTQLRAARTLRGQLTFARMTALERLRRTQLWQRIRPLKWVLLRKLRPNAADIVEESTEA